MMTFGRKRIPRHARRPEPLPSHERKRGHAATCANLRREQAVPHYGGKHERRKQEGGGERGLKEG